MCDVHAAGSVRYSVFSGGGPFTVNSLTGQLLTTGQLDHETMSTYLLTLKAQLLTDSMSFTLAQVTHLHVILILLYFITLMNMSVL